MMQSEIINVKNNFWLIKVHTAVETWVRPSVGPCLAKPKSDNLAFQFSSNRMLDVFRSRKMTCIAYLKFRRTDITY